MTSDESFVNSSCDAWIELNLENLGWNLDRIREKVQVPIMAVVKANGYGHGVVEVGRYLDEREVDHLMVCKLQEAVRLRDAGVTCPILNFGPFCARDADVLVEQDIAQSVFSEEVHSLNRAALKIGKRARIHIHIDAGMGRVGVSYRDALSFLEEAASLEGIHIVGTSMALTEDGEFDRDLIQRFLTLCHEVEKRGIALGLKHAASSDGILTSPSSYLDMVRPGILLYGCYPSEKTRQEAQLALRPVLQLKSRVIAVKTLLPGDSVSYHRAYTARERETYAVIAIGYSDGYPVKAAGKGFVLIQGERFPIIARVTANHIAVLLKPDVPIKPGDEVVLIGAQGKERISAVEAARWGDVTVYQLLARLNPLLPRQVLDGAQPAYQMPERAMIEQSFAHIVPERDVGS